jgi:hypothetical protein
LHAVDKMFCDPDAVSIHRFRRRSYAALFLMLSGSHLYARHFLKCVTYGVRGTLMWPAAVVYLLAFPFRVAMRLLGWSREREPSAASMSRRASRA